MHISISLYAIIVEAYIVMDIGLKKTVFAI